MTDYLDLLGEIKGECPGAPDPMIEQHLRNAAIEFCDRTKALKYTLPAITITEGAPMVALNVPEHRSIIQVQSAQISDYLPMVQASQDALDLWWREGYPDRSRFCDWGCGCDSVGGRGNDWRQYTQSVPEAYFIDQEASDLYRMRLVGIPTATIADSLVVRVSLRPTRDSTSLDGWFIESYFDALANGAKGRLMRMPKKEWSAPDMAAYYLGKFEDDKEAARMESSRDFVRDDESVTHVQSWP